MASIDPISYVRSIPPFDALPQPLFDEAARALEVGYYPAGTRLVRVGGTPLRFLYVIRKGVVRLERDGQTVQVLEEGETFGYTSLLTRRASLDVLVEEDLLAYQLADAGFQKLLADAHFAGHFAAELGERLRNTLERSPVATFHSDLSFPVERLLQRPAAWVEETATVGEAARLMRERRISSVLVRSDPPAIVTDRDFRNRVLAESLGPDTPVARVWTSPLTTVPASTPIYRAWMTLLDVGVHHLPVTREGSIVGVLSITDLLKSTAQGPVAILRGVERLGSRAELPGYANQVAEMTSSLLSGGLEATVIAGFVARLNDALVHRILHWCEEDLGPPPAPYGWMVFGSEGRTEQTLVTDQDNGLVFADAGEGARPWFDALARRVTSDLEAAGFPPCHGGHMAGRWQGTLSEWTARFHRCVDEPRPHDAALFFDFRRVGGRLDLGPLEAAMARAARSPQFIRFLARDAMAFGPPAVPVLRLRAEPEVDLKWQGINPIVFLARCYGIEAGSSARATLERLDAALAAGLVSEEAFIAVTQAYRFLLGLRLRVQLRMIAEGKAPTNKVALSTLSAVERTHLKESFGAIRRWQGKAGFHYQTDV
ncbi:MAG TPA: DUF294 nucleotidyltransferase-like domain-containing protein [Anaeromyxobacteraceae bacterium]|nr:DUF294 nucleotidyltransferase-like domain-containing protein [Anaeromyxobacteraceae bacterium]